MNQEQVNAALSQLMAQGYTQEQAIAAIQQHILQQQQVAQVAPAQQAPVQQQVPNNAMQTGQVVQQTVGLNNILALAQMAGKADDHSLVRTGFAPAQKGRCTVRLRGYVEVGVHKPTNPTHKNREIVHLIFEVNTPQHMITEDNVTKPREIVVRTPKAHSGNAGFPRLFNALNAAHGNRYHHIGEMLGQAWCAEIFHSEPDSNGRIWENFDNDKVWSFKPTSGENWDGSPYSVDVPPLYGEPMFFVFDNDGVTDPTHIKALWDSIYIGGTRSSEKNGQTIETSKNYYQELIRASLTWSESRTRAALSTQCNPETLEPIAPKASAHSQAQKPTQVPSAAATISPVMPQLGGMVTQPQQTPAPLQVAPQAAVTLGAMPDPNVSGVQVQNQTVSVAPTNAEPEVVAPSPMFTAPPTLQEQVQAQPTVIMGNNAQAVTPVVGSAGIDPQAFLAQFATGA